MPAFPGAGGSINDDGILDAALTPRLIQPTTFAEISGNKSERTKQFSEILRHAHIPYQKVVDMHMWQLCHLAMVVPIADAYYEADCSERAGRDWKIMKKTELVQFKEEYESAVRNVDEIINNPYTAILLKYKKAEESNYCIKFRQYALRYWGQLHGVDFSEFGDKDITVDEFNHALSMAQIEKKTDFEGGGGNAENNIIDQIKRRLNVILFGVVKPEDDRKIKIGKDAMLSASNIVFFDELLKIDVRDLQKIIDDRERGNITGLQRIHASAGSCERNEERWVDDYYRELIVRGLCSLGENPKIKVSLRDVQDRIDSLYPSEEENDSSEEFEGWEVMEWLGDELHFCEVNYPQTSLVNRVTYDRILKALVECKEKIEDCVEELDNIKCIMEGSREESKG